MAQFRTAAWLAAALLVAGCSDDPPAVEPPPEIPVAPNEPPPAEPTPPPATGPAPSESLYLWQVSSKSAPGTAWVLGSVPRGADDPGIDKKVWDTFEAADIVALQLDAGAVDTGSMLAKSKETGRFASKLKTLRKALGDELYARTEETLENAGFEVRDFTRVQPWVVYHALDLTRHRARASREHVGLESLVSQHARTKKPVVSLETAEEQLKFFSGVPEKSQIVLLENLLDAPKRAEGIAEAFYSGDDTKLDAAAHGNEAKPVRTLREKRVQVMADRLRDLLDSPQKVLAVLDAELVVGEGGLLDKLSGPTTKVIRLEPTGELAEIPESTPAQRVSSRGYRIEWGRAETSPSKSTWAEGRMIEEITARAGALLCKLVKAPLSEAEKKTTTDALLGEAAGRFERRLKLKRSAESPRQVNDDIPAIEIELKGRGGVVRAMFIATQDHLYTLSATVKQRKYKDDVLIQIDSIFDSFELKL